MNADDLAVGVGRPDVLEGLRVVRVTELRDEHGTVDGQEVEVARLEGVVGRSRQAALDGVDALGLLRGHVDGGARHDHLVNLEPAASGVRRGAQRLVGSLAGLVELVGGVVGPHAADLSGRAEAGDVIHVAVGLVGVDAVLDPDDLLDAQVLLELLLDLVLGVLGVAPRREEAHLSGNHGALTVAVERAALEHEVVGAITLDLADLRELHAERGVLVPGEVQAVVEAAVGVEVEVRQTHLALVVDEKCGAWVADPGVVVLHEQNLDVLDLAEKLVDGSVVLGVHADGDLLVAGDGACDLGEDLLRRLRAVAPHVGAVRPEHPRALLLLVLARHEEPVGLGRGLRLDDGVHVWSSLTNLRCVCVAIAGDYTSP